MIYRSLFRRAWNIAWHHPLFWLLGAVISVITIGGEFSPIFRLFTDVRDYPSLLSAWLYSGISYELFITLKNLVLENPATFTAVLGIGIFMTALGLWIMMIVQGTLIGLIDQLNNARTLRFITALQLGWRRAWQLVMVHFVSFLFMGVLVLIIGLPVLFASFDPVIRQAGPELTLGVFWLLILGTFIPCAIIISLLKNYAACYIVLFGYNWRASILSSLKVFRRHWLDSIEWGLLLFFIDFIGVALIIIFAQPIFHYEGFLSILLAPYGWIWSLVINGGAALVLLGTIGWLGAFRQTVWVILFEHFNSSPAAMVLSVVNRFLKGTLSVLDKTLDTLAGKSKSE